MRDRRRAAQHERPAPPERSATTSATSAAAILRLQRLAGNRAVQRVTIGDEIAEASRGGGDPLPIAAQRRLEDGLGTDMGSVRVHTGGTADRLARAVQAQAFTSGSHIFFRAGAYDPASSTGFERLAHEATHVVQQASGPVAGTDTGDGIALSDPGDRFEREAAATARDLAAG